MFVFFNFRKSVFQKLYELYLEECDKEPEIKVSGIYFKSPCKGKGYFGVVGKML